MTQGNKLYRTILLVVTLFVLLIISHALFSLWQWDKNLSQKIDDELDSRIDISNTVMMAERDKFDILQIVLKAKESEIIDLENYDNFRAISIMFQDITDYFEVDLLFLIIDDTVVASSHSQLESFELPLFFIEFINQNLSNSTQIINLPVKQFQFLTSSNKESSSLLSFIHKVDLVDVTGDEVGQMYSIKLINDNKHLENSLRSATNTDFVLFNKQKQAVLSSMDQERLSIIPFPESNEYVFGGRSFFTKTIALSGLNGHDTAWISLAIDDSFYKQDRQEVIKNQALPFILTVIASISLFLFLRYRVFNKLKLIVKSLNNVTQGNLKTRIQLSSSMRKTKFDEIDGIGRDFNLMMDKLEQSYLDIDSSRHEAELANHSKSEFLANMSHEIRTPINGIMGMTELALETPLNDEQRYLLSTSYSEAESLLMIINDVLDFSKIESGKIELDNIEFDLHQLIGDIANTMGVRASKKTLELLVFIAEDVPRRVIADSVRIRQILVNLLGNALKFTHDGEIFLRIDVSKSKENNIELAFKVKDTGIGIPKEKQAAIFDSFTQVDNSTTRKYGGTGLGTTISKYFVELMGGQIGVTSEVGVGSTFWFNIPVQKAVEANNRHFDSLESLGNLDDVNVLLVDDNETSLFILQQYIQSFGGKVTTAENGQLALDKVNESRVKDKLFDVIITDFRMPELNAPKLIREIRTTPTYERIPVIVISALGITSQSQWYKELNIQGYLPKPINKKTLLKTIKVALSYDEEREEQLFQTLSEEKTTDIKAKSNYHLLLVDDYPTNQQVAVRYLNSSGYQVDIANNGLEAFNAFKDKNYDLIFMDIQMPEMDGYQATKAIRDFESQTSQSRVPIIAMTAHAIKGYREKCLKSGMDDYITKPVKKVDLLEITVKWLDETKNVVDEIGSQPTEEANETSNDLIQDGNIKHIEETIESSEPVNYEKVMSEFDGDREFFIDLLDEFLQNVQSQLGIIEQAIANKDSETIKKEAHAIKGGAANLTAKALSMAASELEQMGKNNELETATEAFQYLESKCQQLCNYKNQLSDS